MSHEKSPAFQFYPKDFLADGHVAAMSLAERGAYITLLCVCWREGSLPNDPTRLARMVGTSVKAFARVWPAVRECFTEVDEGRLVQGRLDKERDKQERFRRRQADAANARWHKPDDATALPRHMPEPCSPISDLRSPISDLPTPVISERADELDVGKRAGRLIEGYAVLYAKHRHGARLRLVGSPLEFQDALSLCKTWDDSRLEKLATIVLTTDDAFISQTDRGFKIFALKATWADDRLRQQEAGAA